MKASSISTLSGLAAAGVIAGAMALSSPSQAATVDHVFHLDLDGMSTGTCAGTICPTPLGTVTVTGDTTSSLDFSVALAPDVNFSAGDSFWFDLSAGANLITFALEAPTSGTIGGEAWNWVTPFSTGSFTPAPGADFPGPYADMVQCTAAGNVCGTELNFTASGADATHPFAIGHPRPSAGNFANFAVPFVANLSIAPGTALCHEDTACTGLVAAPEPSTWAMMLLGFAGLGFFGYRKTCKGTLAA
jgi:PEP-CTERM motif